MKSTLKRQATIALALVGGTIALAWATTGAADARTASERITLTGTSAGTTNRPIRVVASGPIRGIGTATINSGPNHTEPTVLHFPNGTVNAIAIQKAQRIRLNPQKCTATNDSRGTFTITGGTEAFRGARGHLTYDTRAVLVGARTPSGACLGRTAQPSSTSIKSTATGTATLP
jgi:hypothetical protein